MREQLYLTIFSAYFPTISPEFLSLQKKIKLQPVKRSDGRVVSPGGEGTLPVFAIYHPSGSNCFGSYKGYKKSVKTGTNFPGEMSVPEILQEPYVREIHQPFDCTAISTYKGNIPRQVQSLMQLCRKPAYDQVYVIAEAEWSLTYIPPLAATMFSDPLVIALIQDRCFLLAAFDCTTVESYAKEHFGAPRTERRIAIKEE
jgi:hypothetical protein